MEYFTIDIITLGLAIATFIVTLWSFLHNRRREKKEYKQLLARKEAKLRAMEMSMKAGFSASEHASLDMQISALKAEIDELRQQ